MRILYPISNGICRGGFLTLPYKKAGPTNENSLARNITHIDHHDFIGYDDESPTDKSGSVVS